ncbi:hypothetical protein AMC90_CH02792 [Rhizobium phaseoli]|nr:hypothetical protein AMC90_CH02792 [Rhizobium phaseoli]
MIEYALPRAEVMDRATKRGRHIRDHVLQNGIQHTSFCTAFEYYLKNGYPQ